MTEQSMTPDPIGLSTCPSCDDLRRKDVSTRFYEARFASGYVDEWPLEKKQRIEEVIRGLRRRGCGEDSQRHHQNSRRADSHHAHALAKITLKTRC